MQIQPHDVPDLLDEERVFRELERLGPMRAKRKGAPDAVDRVAAQPRRLRQRACAPMRRIRRRRLQGLGQHALHLRIGDRARRPRARLIEQPVEPPGQKARAPLAHRLLRQPQAPGQRGVRLARGRAQHDPRALGQCLGGLGPLAPARQRLALLQREDHGLRGATSSHRGPPFYQENASAIHIVPSTSGTGH